MRTGSAGFQGGQLCDAIPAPELPMGSVGGWVVSSGFPRTVPVLSLLSRTTPREALVQENSSQALGLEKPNLRRLLTMGQSLSEMLNGQV